MSSPRNRPLLILLYDFAPSIGGVQTLFREAAAGMAPPVSVVCAEGPDAAADRAFDRSAPYEVARLPLRERGLLDRFLMKAAILLRMPFLGFHLVMVRRALPRVLSLVRSRRYPVLTVGYHFLSGVAWLVARVTGREYDLFAHGNEFLKMRRSACERFLLRRARRVFVLSRYGVDRCVELGVPRDRVRVVRIGVDLPAPLDAGSLRRKWGIGPEPVVLSLTRLEERKGLDVLMEASAKLEEEGVRLTLLIAGDGSHRDALVRRSEELGLGGTVCFLGRVTEEEKQELYALADLFALVPRVLEDKDEVEGFGIVYLEAAAHGTPSVAGRSGGVPDAVVDGETGVLVDPLSVEEVASALGNLLRDDGLRARLGAAARRRVEDRFRWDEFDRAIRTD